MINEEIKEIEEINSEKELEAKVEFVRENKFSLNKIRYAGVVFIIRSSDGYLIDVGKKRIIEDFLHPGHFIESGHYSGIYTIAKVYSKKSKYDPKDEESWTQIALDRIVLNGAYAETCDHEGLEFLSKKVITRYAGEGKSLFNTDREMDSFGFVRGKVNVNYWFHKTEIEFLDRMLTYKKFDNTLYRTDTKELQKKLLENGHSKEKITEEVSKVLRNNIKYGVESLSFSAFEGLRYTFGVEIETCLGRLEPEDYKDLNVKAVHDGSLRDAAGNTPGGEYVTGVLIGDSGLVQLNELCRALAMKCKVNNQCGVHIHAGGMNWNKEDICYSYILAEQLEDELFGILPKSRRNNSYCRRLTQLTLGYLPELRNSKSSGEYDILIDKIYDIVFREVTYIKGKGENSLSFHSTQEGEEEEFISNKQSNRNLNHPRGSKCGYDKNAQRYCWLNFVTLLYNTKGIAGANTLEIRNHSATMNFNKIKNWIRIFFAIIRFVEMNKSKIRRGRVTLAEVIRSAYPKTHEKLIQYVDERRELFKVHGESVDYEEPAESKKKKTMKEVVSI